MELKAGSRWKSAPCATEVVIVRPPNGAVVLECGGVPMAAAGQEVAAAALAADHANGTLIGKRYFDAESGLEVLAAKAGQGSLSVDGRPMPIKEAKALPSSD